MARRRIRWRGAVAAALVLAAVGVWEASGTLLLSAVLPLAYLAYGAVSTAPGPDGLSITRRIDPTTAPPGRPVRVTLTLRNDSGRTISDVRLVDRVPEELAVLDGSPRCGRTLDDGESVEIDYRVIARRGTYDFPAPRLRLRGSGAGAVTTTALEPEGDDRLVCRLDADAPPLSDRGNDGVGQLTGEDPGPGLTFHSTREYQRGDPADRIDWRRYAKQGELATIDYERWVSTTAVFVLDARAASRVSAGPGRPDAVELGAYAVTRAATTLLRAGHDVAVAVVGVDGSGPSGLLWLPPGGGTDQRGLAVDLLAEAVEAEPAEVATGTQFREVASLASPGSQFVLVSPLLDDEPAGVVENWAALNYPRTVLSTDIVAENTVSGRYEQVRRHTRLARCQATGAQTIDWRRGTPLSIIIDYAFGSAARAGGPTQGGL